MEENNKVNEDEMIEIAKEANTIINQKDKELADLKLKLARNELYRTVDDEPVVVFDPNQKFNPIGKTNMEISEFVVNSHDYHVGMGKPSPLGEGGQVVADYLRQCLADSDGDSEQFILNYQKGIKK